MPDKNWADVFTYLAKKEVVRRTKVRNSQTDSSKDRSSKVPSTKPRRSKTCSSAAISSEIHSSEVGTDSLGAARSAIADIGSAISMIANIRTSRPLIADIGALGSVIADLGSACSAVAFEKSATAELRLITAATAVKNSSQSRKRAIPLSERKRLLHPMATCEHRDSEGRQCKNNRFLQIDHIRSWSRGGTHHPENLQVLCGVHNRLKYKKEGAHA